MVKERAAEERRKYPLELRLKENIIGQEAAIATVASGRDILLAIRVFLCIINLILLTLNSYTKERRWLDRRGASFGFSFPRLIRNWKDGTR